MDESVALLDPPAQLPYPDEAPVLKLWPDVGQALGLGRTATFAAAQRGDFPWPIWKISNRLVVPTAAFRAALGLPLTRPS
jgi:hypothetical protein